MSLTLQVGFFNSYYVKRLADVPYIPSTSITRTANGTQSSVSVGQPVSFNAGLPVAVGMFITGTGITLPTKVTAVSTATSFRFDQVLSVTNSTSYTFGYDWTAPQTVNADEDWYIEESRIRGGYNNVYKRRL